MPEFQKTAMELGVLRRKKADDLLAEADFGDWSVAASNGWEDSEPGRLTCEVFLEHDELTGPSKKIQFGINFAEGSTEPEGEPEFELPKTPRVLFGYYVNLDERGEFYADVRAADGESIFDLRSDDDGRIQLIEDGFLGHKNDLDGLQQYLQHMGLMPDDAELLDMASFEDALDDQEEELAAPGF